ncbi:MAG: TIGR03620 family F420-dependent LLM class oxidoreductase [Actinobacteria bacterium]|nr:TIGR03620 family F420-dependent LLM class oxidoreductase [Actinomycetota bacterium]
MTAEHDALRARLGRIGAWTFAFDALPAWRVREVAAEIESLGFGALWVPEGSASREIFAHMSLLLSATERITVGSGIANITLRHPHAMASGARTLADAYGERVVLGIGVGHPYSTEMRGIEWARPLSRMRDYLDIMDAAPSTIPEPAVPARRLLAALGPRMLSLSRERALGAHSYFVPVEHTIRAREILGPAAVLAVEQTVVADADPSRARSIARSWAAHYLELPNYGNNLLRLGFAQQDLTGGGSDRLIDATVAWGGVEAVTGRVLEHLDAGADHVCLQVISGERADPSVPQLLELAAALT